MINELKNYIPMIHKEGYVIILIALVVTIIMLAASNAFGVIALVFTILCFVFFRDPERVTHPGTNLVVSPADGIVQQISEVYPPQELDLPAIKMKRVSIFLSVFDVHVNRVPVSGVVKSLVYRPGKFINASLDKASDDNERETILMDADYNHTPIVVVQIAGLIARRIVCDLLEGSHVIGGNRFGIIKFGSRVDLYLPTEAHLQILVGQRMVGGETVITDLSKEDVRELHDSPHDSNDHNEVVDNKHSNTSKKPSSTAIKRSTKTTKQSNTEVIQVL